MGYYDDDYNYEESGAEYEEFVEPVSLVAEDCKETDITNVLADAGLVNENNPRLSCTMEKLVYVYGNSNEVYSPAEIGFTESVDKVLVYSDFFKKLNKGSMVCRVIAAVINCAGYDALKACVSFEKIINKAFDGYNVFFFVTEDSVWFGCRIFDKKEKRDCTISKPIKDEETFEQLCGEIAFSNSTEEFMEFYNQFMRAIACEEMSYDDFENQIIRRRGMQFSYLEEMDRLERDTGINMSGERERYFHMFEDIPEISFPELLEEVEESLSFIKSNRVNTYEMLFEADEMMRQAEDAERENDRIAQQLGSDYSRDASQMDKDTEKLLENPEEMVKALKKRKGI